MSVTKDEDEFRGFGALSRLMDIGVLVVSRQIDVEFASPQAIELLGCADRAQLRQRWPELKSTLGLDPRKLEASAKPVRLTADIDLPGPPRSLRLEIYDVNEEACTAYLVLLKDRRAADALETELLLASQMRSLPHFYRVLAHDIKAPLNAMQLTLELLADPHSAPSDPAREAKRQRYLGVLKEEIARLDRLLQTMLGRNDPVGSASTTFDSRELVGEIAALLTPQARLQRVTLETEVPEAPVPITGMRDRLKQALLNVAINGLEAMPRGGRLALRLRREPKAVSVACEDTGPGMPKEILDEIFRIHFTTKKAGTGIGMYAARLVAESHGGEITVESAAGSGTRVALVVPTPG